MMSDTQLDTECALIVRRLKIEHDWRLLAEGVWAQAVFDQSSPHIPPDQRRCRAISIYCQAALYPACQGTQGAERQKRGFEELSRYLYRLAEHRWPDVAEDATQEALLVVYRQIGQCRYPAAFLAFAIQRLRDAARKHTRTQPASSLEELLEDGAHKEPALAETSVETSTHAAMVRQGLRARLQAIMQQNPRAHRQWEAVRLRYFEELRNEEIAVALGTTAENVSVLINRALEKLRTDKALVDLANELWPDQDEG